jgi:hypothetical protein
MAQRNRATTRESRENAKRHLDAAFSNAPSDPDMLGALSLYDPAPSWTSPVAAVVAAFEAHGLDPATLPAERDWSVAFGRAVESVRGKYRKDYSIMHGAAGPNGERRMCILSVARNGVVTTETIGIVTCPNDGAAAYIELADPAGIAAEIIAEAAPMVGVYNSSDIQHTVVEVYESVMALPCRDLRPFVTYFVLPAGLDKITRLGKAVADCGWGKVKLFIGRKSDAQSHEVAVDAANSGLERRLSEYAAKAQKYANEPGTRPSTIEAQIAYAAELIREGDVFAELLGSSVVVVRDRAEAIRASLRSALTAAANAPTSPATSTPAPLPLAPEVSP